MVSLVLRADSVSFSESTRGFLYACEHENGMV